MFIYVLITIDYCKIGVREIFLDLGYGMMDNCKRILLELAYSVSILIIDLFWSLKDPVAYGIFMSLL